jgi:hypothetical protein
MAQGVVGLIGSAVPTSFETRNPGLFTRPLVGVRGEPYDRVVRVLRLNAAQEPLGATGQPLGGTPGSLVDSLGRDASGNPIKVPGLRIDVQGRFVGNDGTTAVEVDPTTSKPKRYDGSLYEPVFAWFPTAEQVAPALFGAPVDRKGRPITNLRLDSDGHFTSLDGGTSYPVNAATGYPERPGTGVGAPQSITTLDFGLCELAKSINLALLNGAMQVWAFRTHRNGSSPTMDDAFADFSNKQINLVCLSKKTDAQAISDLKDHVEQASPNDSGGGGTRPRMGVAMLPKTGWTSNGGAPKPSQKLADFGINWTSSRMVLMAHKSDDDVAAAVAGLIARHEPWVSLTMKPLTGIGQPQRFTDTEVAVWLDPEAQGIVQARVNPLVDPEFLAGAGLVMGESYTADGTGQRLYIDIVRTLDDLAFRLKAHLTNPNVIGTMRINRTGLTGLRTVVAALLDSRVAVGEIDGYSIDIPLLGILQKNPAQRTPEETQQINTVQNSRRLEFSVSADYTGAIHYLLVTLKLV